MESMIMLKTLFTEHDTVTSFSISSKRYRAYGRMETPEQGICYIKSVTIVDYSECIQNSECIQDSEYEQARIHVELNDSNRFILADLAGIVYDSIHSDFSDVAYFDSVVSQLL